MFSSESCSKVLSPSEFTEAAANFLLWLNCTPIIAEMVSRSKEDAVWYLTHGPLLFVMERQSPVQIKELLGKHNKEVTAGRRIDHYALENGLELMAILRGILFDANSNLVKGGIDTVSSWVSSLMRTPAQVREKITTLNCIHPSRADIILCELVKWERSLSAALNDIKNAQTEKDSGADTKGGDSAPPTEEITKMTINSASSPGEFTEAAANFLLWLNDTKYIMDVISWDKENGKWYLNHGPLSFVTERQSPAQIKELLGKHNKEVAAEHRIDHYTLEKGLELMAILRGILFDADSKLVDSGVETVSSWVVGHLRTRVYEKITTLNRLQFNSADIILCELVKWERSLSAVLNDIKNTQTKNDSGANTGKGCPSASAEGTTKPNAQPSEPLGVLLAWESQAEAPPFVQYFDGGQFRLIREVTVDEVTDDGDRSATVEWRLEKLKKKQPIRSLPYNSSELWKNGDHYTCILNLNPEQVEDRTRHGDNWYDKSVLADYLARRKKIENELQKSCLENCQANEMKHVLLSNSVSITSHTLLSVSRPVDFKGVLRVSIWRPTEKLFGGNTMTCTTTAPADAVSALLDDLAKVGKFRWKGAIEANS